MLEIPSLMKSWRTASALPSWQLPVPLRAAHFKGVRPPLTSVGDLEAAANHETSARAHEPMGSESSTDLDAADGVDAKARGRLRPGQSDCVGP